MVKFWNSLRVRLILLVTLATIPALACTFHSYRENRYLAASLFQQSALHAAGQVSTATPILVDSARHLLVSLAHDPTCRNLDAEGCGKMLEASFGNHTRLLYADLGMIDLDGNLICSGRPFSGQVNLSDQHGFQQALKTREFSVGTYRFAHGSAQTLVGFSYPVLDPTGDVRAVLFVAMEPAWLDRLLLASVLPPGSVMTIIDEEGTVLGRSSDAEEWIGKKLPQTEIVQACLDKRDGLVEAAGIDGIRKHYGIKPLTVASRVGYVYAGIPVDLVDAEAWQALRAQLIWMMIAFGITIALIWTSGYHLVLRKARIILSAARKLAQGDLTARTALRDKDGEIGGLGAALDQMADHVQSRESERDEALAKLAKEQELSRTIIESLPGIFYVIDEQGRMRMWNKEFEVVSGHSTEEVARMNPFHFAVKENREAVEKAFRDALETGEVSMESSWRTPSGTTVSYYTNGRTINIGGTKCLVGLAVDVTARKAAEEKVHQSEQMLKDILATSPVGIALVENRVVHWANEAWEKMFRFQRPVEYVGKSVCFLYGSEEEYERVGRVLYDPLRPGRITETDAIMRRTDGSFFDAHLRARLSHLSHTSKQVVIIANSDISDRKKAEEALRFEREQLLSIFDSIDQAISVIDPISHEVLYVNRYLRDLYGKDPTGEICRWTFHDRNSPCRFYPCTEVLDLHGSPHVWECDDPMLQRNFSVTDRLIQWPDGRIVKFTIAIDITERKRAEQQLRAVIESSPVGIAILRGGAFLYGNAVIAKMFGVDDPRLAVGRRIEEFFAPGERDAAARRARDRELGNPVPSHFETIGQRANGETFDMGVWVSEIDYEGGTALLGFVIDISEMKSLRAQLFQAQKMEAIGTLAGGIAHDFNNLLTVVTGYGELLLADKTSDDPSYYDLQKIYAAGRRGAELVQRLLTFSRKAESKPTPINLNSSVEQAKNFLERIIPKMIDIELRLAADLELVNADPTQMEQILMNLAVNARDAMPTGGKLIIETRNVVTDEEYCRSQVDAKEGPHVMLRVSDTGHGMDRDTLERVFEPFFTTKEPGKGTGLGLAMVFGIVKQHEGHITCDSQAGKGTTFRLYFPVGQAGAQDLEVSSSWEPLRGSETILLVDDEEPCRDLGQRILSPAGYGVLTAANGKEAVDIYLREKDRIELVILDLIMPEMGGRQCFEELQKIDPQIKVIVTSGYTSAGTMKVAEEIGAKGFVSKPYEVKGLLQSVRHALDGS